MSQQAVDAFLPIAFRSFLLEIHAVETRIRQQLGGTVPRDAEPPSPAALRGQLIASLRQQQTAARVQGRDPDEPVFLQALYLMAAVADAVFADLHWTGRQYFEANPLRDEFPLPEGVDPDILAQVRSLVNRELPDVELAQVLLLVLSVEFPGAAQAAPEALAEGRRRLFGILAERLPGFGADPERLFPDAYERRQSPEPATRLPEVKAWRVALLWAAGVFLLASFLVWRGATESVRNLVEQILLALS